MAAEPVAERLALLFEGAPRFIARLRAVAPGAQLEELLDHAENVALSMPEDEQIELLNAHPRIGAAPASVSPLSYREQGYDRGPGPTALQARLDRLNDDYERRFGFRFVIYVAGRSRAEIADVMERQLKADREREKERALRDVVAIARDRAAKLGISGRTAR